jgi:hypothetical protein
MAPIGACSVGGNEGSRGGRQGDVPPADVVGAIDGICEWQYATMFQAGGSTMRRREVDRPGVPVSAERLGRAERLSER